MMLLLLGVDALHSIALPHSNTFTSGFVFLHPDWSNLCTKLGKTPFQFEWDCHS